MTEREMVTSVTITNGELYLNGRRFPYYLDPSGPVVADTSDGIFKLIVVPIMVDVFDYNLITDLRGTVQPPPSAPDPEPTVEVGGEVVTEAQFRAVAEFLNFGTPEYDEDAAGGPTT